MSLRASHCHCSFCETPFHASLRPFDHEVPQQQFCAEWLHYCYLRRSSLQWKCHFLSKKLPQSRVCTPLSHSPGFGLHSLAALSTPFVVYSNTDIDFMFFVNRLVEFFFLIVSARMICQVAARRNPRITTRRSFNHCLTCHHRMLSSNFLYHSPIQ